MKTKKRTEITIETDRLLVIRKGVLARGWCSWCGRQVVMVTADEAAGLAGVSSRTIYRWVETGRLHFTETAEGRLRVCYESISSREIVAE